MFKVNNLTFRYPKNKEDTIKGISFAIEEGEIFGLLGPSGVGKSTTQKILVKLLGRFGGEVFYKGKDLRAYGREFYQEIGVGFEMPVHFSKLTAMENMTFFQGLYRAKADLEDLLKQLGLYEDRDKKVAEFSKGMEVRLNFARALLNKPEILFLDEPTNGLDPVNARIVKDMIRAFQQKGGTVLLTTHLMNDVDELCDRVAFIADGKIAEIDTPKNLKLKYGERKVELEYREGGIVKKESFDMEALPGSEAFMKIIRTKELVTIHSKETNLDDIFIKVTGVERHA